MKLTTADKWFSKLIREAAHWTCQKCGIISEEGRATGGDRAMQCSHFISRQYKSVRLDSNNALCLCASCHAHVEKDPSLHCDLYDSINGAGLREIISQKKWEVMKPVGGWKAYEKEAAKFYKKQHEEARERRKNGFMGSLDIINFN
tara:strand:+ start:10124 stop:10561 length:438 start_codon:yes stop_codon:yes gene_type:complete